VFLLSFRIVGAEGQMAVFVQRKIFCDAFFRPVPLSMSHWRDMESGTGRKSIEVGSFRSTSRSMRVTSLFMCFRICSGSPWLRYRQFSPQGRRSSATGLHKCLVYQIINATFAESFVRRLFDE